MTRSNPIQEEHDRLAHRLEVERPVPGAAFRGDLRRRLLNLAGATAARPRRFRLLISAYATSGLGLLAIAAVGVGVAGPFAA